jgi:hypothetical protein
VYFDTTAKAFAAASTASYDLAANTGIMFYAHVKFETTGAFRMFISKSSGAGVQWYFNTDASGFLSAAATNGTVSTSCTISTNHVDGKWHDIVGGMARTGSDSVLFIRSEIGYATSTGTGLGSIANASPFRIGGPTNFTSVHRPSFVAVGTTGALDVFNNSDEVLRRIRRYTGRS